MKTSWDCFDTLVARRKLDPLSVFYAIGETHGLDNFTARRKAAESRAPWTLDSIYEELAKDFGWSEEEKEHFKNVEIETEVEHCCPINENIRQVKDGDLVVSDMYLPPSALKKILNKNGLDKNVEIIVTTGGKHDGTIWKELPPVKMHVGDNFRSDVESPRSFGIEGKHYTSCHLTELEREIGGDLALLMRIVRLANPYEPGSLLHSMWNDQAQLNIPSLVLAALELPSSNVAFVMRDCVHLQPIHEAIYGTQNSSFHCSRIAFKKEGDAFARYAHKVACGKVIVDLQGSGNSITKYWEKNFGEKPQLLYVTGSMTDGSALIPSNHDALERFNSSPLGSMLQYPWRKECEFHPQVLQCQANAVACAVQHIPYFSFRPSIDLLSYLISLMFGTVTMRHNVHVANHEIV